MFFTTLLIHPFGIKADPVDCALDLMRRLPPQKVEENLAHLVELAPHLTEDLLSAIDQPLKLQRCKQTGRDFLLCDYNRDGDSYRCVCGAYNSAGPICSWIYRAISF